MGKGSKPEPQITQVPTKSPQQTQFLDSLLSFFPQAMAGQTIGGAYGGPGQANYSPISMDEGKGGAGGGAGGGGIGSLFGSGPRRGSPQRNREGYKGLRGEGSPLDKVLTEPFVGPSRQAQTGNFRRRQ